MIVKLRTSSWSYFESQEIHIETFVKYKDVEQDGSSKLYLRGVFTEGLATDEEREKATNKYYDNLELTVITLISNNYMRIVTDLPGYILNNEGKTIDRIN